MQKIYSLSRGDNGGSDGDDSDGSWLLAQCPRAVGESRIPRSLLWNIAKRCETRRVATDQSSFALRYSRTYGRRKHRWHFCLPTSAPRSAALPRGGRADNRSIAEAPTSSSSSNNVKLGQVCAVIHRSDLPVSDPICARKRGRQ